MTLIGDRTVKARSPAVHGVVGGLRNEKEKKTGKVVTVLVVCLVKQKEQTKVSWWLSSFRGSCIMSVAMLFSVSSAAVAIKVPPEKCTVVKLT